MAIVARLTKQMPWVGTPEQKYLVKDKAEKHGMSQAAIVRQAIDEHFGLRNGMFTEGDARREAFEASDEGREAEDD